jgi:hypothetical protein
MKKAARENIINDERSKKCSSGEKLFAVDFVAGDL